MPDQFISEYSGPHTALAQRVRDLPLTAWLALLGEVDMVTADKLPETMPPAHLMPGSMRN